MHTFMIISFAIITLIVRLYVRVAILFPCGKRFHDHTIALKRKVWVHKTSITSLYFIAVPVPSSESEWSCICVFGVSRLPLCTMYAYWILELCGQCGILELCGQCGILELCGQCDILELCGQCDIFCFFVLVYFPYKKQFKLSHHEGLIMDNCTLHYFLSIVLGLWCLAPLSTIFELYRGGSRVTNKHHELHLLNIDILYDCCSEILVDINTMPYTN